MKTDNRHSVAGSLFDRRGLRLHKLELCNWGTFDGHVFTVRPAGKSTLLIGQNGSGKSTVVDALLTLLVRPSVRNFNVAAGAKRRERDERSYLLGAYDRAGDGVGSGISVKYLRPKGEQYSVILACFRNEVTGKTFTAAQVLYLTTDHSVEKVYCFADDERSIQNDFGQLESPEGMQKLLRGRGLRTTRTFQEFETWFTKAAKVKPKAMEVFNQTVAVKDIQRLNDFIRDHMLEPCDWAEKVDGLLGHFTQLNEAHDSLIRVRKQRDLLEPVAQAGIEFLRQCERLNGAERLLAGSAAYFSQRTIDLLELAIASKIGELHTVARQKESLAAEIRIVQERIRSLRNEVDNVGGDRLKQIPALIAVERAHAERKNQVLDRLRRALDQLELLETIQDDAGLLAVRSQLPAIQEQLRLESIRCDAEREQLLLDRAQVRQQLSALRDDLDGLNRRRENVPEWCVELRQSICNELDLPIQDLPFAAELMQVQAKARDWESSIEKVLHGLALTLLVPEQHYSVLSAHVDRTRLAARGRGQRLVYLRVTQHAAADARFAPGRHSLMSKLEFRDEHVVMPWLKTELQTRYDYVCCETIEEFQNCRGAAMTRNRHVKSARQRHEKDDRDQAGDPRNFVLGWDNREKRKRIAATTEELTLSDQSLSVRLDEINQQLARIRCRLSAIDEVHRIANFSEVNSAAHQLEIVRLEDERRAIEDQSGVLRLLKQRLIDAENQESSLRVREHQLFGDERAIEIQIAHHQKQIGAAAANLRTWESDGRLIEYQSLYGELDGQQSVLPLTPENLDEARTRFHSRQSKLIAELRGIVEPLRNQLTNLMSRFLRECPELAAELRVSTDYLDDFMAIRRRILDDDLPRYEQRFKVRLNQKVIEEIGLFRSALEQERRKIEDKIELLNVSLKKLEYRPGTHIRLESRAVHDAEISDFQARLRLCVEGSFEDTAVANEARFVRIKELIVRLRDDVDRRWRDKVTDVRRWFDFVAAVISHQTGKTVSVYQDSGGQSGGEKAKLAFTILVAAIAYQYDLDPEQSVSDRFHFVVVDEMFSKVDDQHAEYALDLFQQFGLQLLIVAPLDAKARVTQPYVGCYLHAVKKDNRSSIFEMTSREFDEVAIEENAVRPAVVSHRK